MHLIIYFFDLLKTEMISGNAHNLIEMMRILRKSRNQDKKKLQIW